MSSDAPESDFSTHTLAINDMKGVAVVARLIADHDLSSTRSARM
jgi:hypothetical protein